MSPDNGSMVVDLTPTMHWEVPTDADDQRNRSIVSYDVYVDTEETFDGATPVTVGENNYTPVNDLAEDMMYYWKVVAMDDDGGTTESETWSFWTNSTNSIPAEFTLLTPTDGEETDVRPTFSWTASSDEDLYDELIYVLSYGTDPFDMTDVVTGSDLSFIPLVDLLDNTNYVWQVMAEDESGATYVTPMQSFMVNTENNNPYGLALLSPEDNAIVTEFPLLVFWNHATDPDGDSIWYEINIDYSRELVGTTSNNYFFIDSLQEDIDVLLTVTTRDEDGGYLESDQHLINVNLYNTAPNAFELISPIAMEEGLKFAIREGGKTVGAGVVAKIIE